MSISRSVALLALTCVGLSSLAACIPPDPALCTADEPGCVAHLPPQPRLPGEAVAAELEAIHQRYAEAAADGLDPSECAALSASYLELYARDPSVLVARFDAAAVHEACGANEAAEEIYVELAAAEFPPALNNLGVLAWQRGEREQAFSLFARAVELDEVHALEARNNLAMALRERYAEAAKEADFEAAEQHLRNILAVDSANKSAYENLARLYYDRGRLRDRAYLVLAELVVTQAQRVLEAKHQRSADLHNLRGLLLMQDDDQVRALRAFKRAVEVEPNHLDANRNIAMIAIRFRDYAEAEQSLERVIAHDPSVDTDAWLALGVARRGMKKYEDAEQAYRQALVVDGTDPRPWFNLGVLAQEHLSALAGDDQELIAAYELARDHFQSFVDQAGPSARWTEEIAEAKDRIVIVDDAIDTIREMKIIQQRYDDILAAEAAAEAARIEKLRQMEAGATSVSEIVGE